MAKLTVNMHGEDELVFELRQDRCSIGRATDNIIRINDPSVSLHHARISCEDGACILSDLDSTNGTRINGHYVKSEMLADADRVRFGQVRCVFQREQTVISTRRGQANLLRVSRQGQLLGYFTPENARENLRRGKLRADDVAWHDSV